MAELVAYLPDPVMHARLLAAVQMDRAARASHRVRFAASWAEMDRLARAIPPGIALFDPYAAPGMESAPWTALAARFPSTVLFAYGDFRASAASDILRLARTGVHGASTRGVDDSPAALRLLLAEALAHSVTGAVVQALGDGLPPDLVPLVRFLLELGPSRATPDQAARFHRCHPKTLREHLKRAGLPPVQKLIVWLHLLRAAHLLGDPGRSVENVALTMGYPSANAFRNQLARYAGVAPRELAAQGGFGYLVAEFRRRSFGARSAAGAAE